MDPEGKKRDTSRINISITFDSEREAENAGEALKVDDDEFVSTIVEGRTVRGVVTSDSPEGARRAADDWLACLMAIAKKDTSGGE
ncbi:MAG: KEOPS complex subunit Pcc1 [Thermoplasmatota archaeon]